MAVAMNDWEIEQAAHNFALLVDPTRLRILHTLMEHGELSAHAVAEAAGRRGVLIGFGLYLQNMWGLAIGVIGVVPLVAGIFNFCVFAPLFGGPFDGRRLALKA
jgi:DNA-binding transcriptional ArsR family regulator